MRRQVLRHHCRIARHSKLGREIPEHKGAGEYNDEVQRTSSPCDLVRCHVFSLHHHILGHHIIMNAPKIPAPMASVNATTPTATA